MDNINRNLERSDCLGVPALTSWQKCFEPVKAVVKKSRKLKQSSTHPLRRSDRNSSKVPPVYRENPVKFVAPVRHHNRMSDSPVVESASQDVLLLRYFGTIKGLARLARADPPRPNVKLVVDQLREGRYVQ